ncbi:MAG TPA: GPMC system transcriptional regulator [Geobacteraceae bacterium]|nr:GPMC system transcriptional regulator [Geobacteraceae bacterium]
MGTIQSQINQVQEKIAGFGKENLEEILHAIANGARLITERERIRIYLEDLTRGALSCAFASGPSASEIMETIFPIVSADSRVSMIFISREPADQDPWEKGGPPLDRSFGESFGIGHTFLVPLTSQGKSLGVVCIDSEDANDAITPANRTLLFEFLGNVGEKLDIARKYHQQLLLARRVEKYKKREAAGFMVRSAVRLIDHLSLAAVLVPIVGRTGRETMEILASHSEDPVLKAQFDALGEIALEKGKSLISRYMDIGAVISADELLNPLYISDLTAQRLQKRAITEQMALRSLYVVPRYEPDTRKVICLVNYFTRDVYQFSDFEMGLLQTHAEMVERVIREIGGEHLEIKVLAEISELLREPGEGLITFLNKVLSKATELIGADTGSIAVLAERDGEKWLMVEDEQGNILGAKNKEWLKKNIPPFRIGGYDLHPDERSLTGYVAWSKKPKIIGRVEEEGAKGGFHRSMHELIRSEIAVPIISDDEVIAVICLNSLKPSYFTEEHQRILQIIDHLTSRHISDIQRIERLQREVTHLQSDVAYKDPQVSSYRLGNIIGNSRKAQELVDFINVVTRPLFNRIALWGKHSLQEATIGLPSILILGQTGSGKEFFFNNLYNNLNEIYRKEINPNGELPVKKTNIAAYSGELTYSELFGHKKGAFTGAYNDRKGILEEADGGVVFLDEIGDADPKTQVQLLRFLDNGGFMRLGENMERYGRVLLVASTNKNLQAEIKRGNFREDLYHRLSELSVEVPSLNDRREDIPDLAVHFLGKLYRTYSGKDDPYEDPPMLAEEAKQKLVTHFYTGNLRELRSILLRALFFRQGKLISGGDIERAIHNGKLEDKPPDKRMILDQQVANEILQQIEEGKDFWEAVYEPYSRNLISRESVRLVIDGSRTAAGKSMPRVAAYLKAVKGEIAVDEEERKRFFKFKNFLYKTIKI